MPCDTIQTTDIVFGANTNHDRMVDGLKMIELSPYQSGGYIHFNGGAYNTDTNILTLQGSNVDQRTAEVKQAYSAAVVKAQARKFGWKLEETGRFQYAVTKRTM